MKKDKEYGEDHSFLGCHVTQFGRNIAIFWRNLLPPSLVQKMDAAGSYADLLPVYQTTWQYKLEDHKTSWLSARDLKIT